MGRAISLFFALAVVWLLLSGHFDGLLLALGALSCGFVVYLARRMQVLDREGHPLHLGFRLPGYWLWLAMEIIKANIDVARRTLDPRLPIDPRLFELDASQPSDLGRVIYANSITLTPGTVATDVGASTIQVHALNAEAEDALRAGAMDAKVTALEHRP